MSGEAPVQKSKTKILALSLGALGVVYGDIGTSPLYAVREIFFNHQHHVETSAQNVLGVISLVFWALTIIVSFKYVVLVLRADNDGEGGVFALFSLLKQYKTKFSLFVSALLIFAAGLLFGDGIITPAISVLSAVEGLTVATPFFTPYVIPITLAIITGLFMVQSRGTAKIGAVFGPIVGVWFVSIVLLGLRQILLEPGVLVAVNPIYAFHFLTGAHVREVLLVLGSVMLVVTGGEAMYADMGHFGRLPIRLSWFSIVYPALLVNYFGQGAYLLRGGEVVNGNLFFSMVPPAFLIPMVILATLATIIASQALITGAFSLAAQALGLKLLPFMEVRHTHEEHEGQLYVPFINWALYAGCVLLVIYFGTSSNLASAYGLAVSGVMFVTALGMMVVARKNWGWSAWSAYSLFSLLAAIDASFLIANSLKFLSGGFVPVIIAIAIYLIMQSWAWGLKKVIESYAANSRMTIRDLIKLKEEAEHAIPKSMVIVAYNAREDLSDPVPMLQQTLWDRYGELSKHIIFLSVKFRRMPHISQKNRYKIHKFYEDRKKGSIVSVIVNHGFMEEINLDEEFLNIAEHEHINIDNHPSEWLIHVSHERVVLGEGLRMFDWLRYTLFQFLSRNSATIDEFWGLGTKSQLSVEVVPVWFGEKPLSETL